MLFVWQSEKVKKIIGFHQYVDMCNLSVFCDVCKKVKKKQGKEKGRILNTHTINIAGCYSRVIL